MLVSDSSRGSMGSSHTIQIQISLSSKMLSFLLQSSTVLASFENDIYNVSRLKDTGIICADSAANGKQPVINDYGAQHMAKLKLTRATIAQLEPDMELSTSMADVFAKSGVKSSSYYRWMGIGRALAEEDLEHPDIPEPPQRRAGESDRKFNRRLRRHKEGLKLYATLYEKMQKAKAIGRIKIVAALRAVALKGNWRAALAFLERRDPDNWMKKRILRNLATGEKHDQHQHSVTAPDMVELMRILGQIERSLSNVVENDIRAGARNGADSQPEAE